uniref:Integrase catalytic domain-containing protein n=1 Tax=Trichogramma kaykai TaxID=54128 RepID=A0ABD2WAT7_9HYME
MGIDRSGPTPYHPATSGLLERWHRSAKAAFMFYLNTENWIDILPSVLPGLRTMLVCEIEASPAEMLYGSPLRIPGDLCVDPQAQLDPKVLSNKLRAHMNKKRPVPVKHKTNQNAFVTNDLRTCSYVFKRDMRVKPPLVPPYTGPHGVLNRNELSNTFTIDDR